MEETALCVGHTIKMNNLIRNFKDKLKYQRERQIQIEQEFQETLAIATDILNRRIEHEKLKK